MIAPKAKGQRKKKKEKIPSQLDMFFNSTKVRLPIRL